MARSRRAWSPVVWLSVLARKPEGSEKKLRGNYLGVGFDDGLPPRPVWLLGI